jgi:hypothetical protein
VNVRPGRRDRSSDTIEFADSRSVPSGRGEGGCKLIQLIQQNFAVYFLLMWLAVTTFLSVMSGWFRLMGKFPDPGEAPLLQIKRTSGTMGPGVSLRSILTLSVCPSGLQVRMMRLFGPFCRDFFVPWKSIAITRETSLFSPVVKLHFGNPVLGALSIPTGVADRLADAAPGRWPETGPGPEEGRNDVFRGLLTRWAVFSCSGALFFIIVPRLGPGGHPPPIAMAILFPAVVFGVVAIVRFYRGRR